jgi:hypothetical protein
MAGNGAGEGHQLIGSAHAGGSSQFKALIGAGLILA